MSLQKHMQLGSERDLHSTASSISLPSVKKAPKKRRLSLGAFFRRRPREPKRKPRDLVLSAGCAASVGGVEGIASIESIHSDTYHDKALGAGPAAPPGAAAPAAAEVASTFTGGSHASTSSAASSSSSSSSSKAELLECPLCLLRHTRDNFPDIMTCPHRSCADCLRQYLRIEISESRVNISCPECAERFNPNDIRAILADVSLSDKYEEFMLRRWLVADPDCRWCPAPDCG